MREYRDVATFFYKNQKYLFLIDENDNNFFLRVDNEDDSKLSYCTLQEFVELQKIFSHHFTSMNIEQGKSKIRKFVPAIIIGATLTRLTLPLSIGISAYVHHEKVMEQRRTAMISSYSTDVKDDEYDHKKVQEYLEKEAPSELSGEDYVEGSLYVTINDSKYLNKVFDYSSVSKEELKQTVKENDNINEQFKKLISEYIDAVTSKYPDIDLRIFYENLKDLKVVECDRMKMLEKTLNGDATGCYIAKENTIYVFEGKQYEKGTWDYQVIYHELSHCLRTRHFDKDDKHYRLVFENSKFYNTTMSEALNSIFAVSLLGYEEKDVAYQLQSNIHGVMLDSMDNYSLSDYVNHSSTYYAKKLDEFNGETNRATTILTLMELQYKDYHSDEIKVEQQEFYPIYEYVSKMYYKNRINSDMSYEEARKVADELVARITFDVPEEYNIDTEYFYKYFNEYCKNIGISVKTY